MKSRQDRKSWPGMPAAVHHRLPPFHAVCVCCCCVQQCLCTLQERRASRACLACLSACLALPASSTGAPPEITTWNPQLSFRIGRRRLSQMDGKKARKKARKNLFSSPGHHHAGNPQVEHQSIGQEGCKDKKLRFLRFFKDLTFFDKNTFFLTFSNHIWISHQDSVAFWSRRTHGIPLAVALFRILSWLINTF